MRATIGDMLQKIRAEVINSPAINALIGSRYFPQKVDLEEFTSEFPYVASSMIGGIIDKDNYEYNIYYLDFMYISTNSIDESLQIYESFRDIINMKVFKIPEKNCSFMVTEDSVPVDVSGIFGDNILYIYVNSYKIRKVN